MSCQAIDDFRKLIDQDSALQAKANELAAAEVSLAEWVAFGSENSFEYTEAEAAAFMKETEGDQIELTEFELEFVSTSGGDSPFN